MLEIFGDFRERRTMDILEIEVVKCLKFEDIWTCQVSVKL